MPRVVCRIMVIFLVIAMAIPLAAREPRKTTRGNALYWVFVRDAQTSKGRPLTKDPMSEAEALKVLSNVTRAAARNPQILRNTYWLETSRRCLGIPCRRKIRYDIAVVVPAD
jgi:hypothetical protein